MMEPKMIGLLFLYQSEIILLQVSGLKSACFGS